MGAERSGPGVRPKGSIKVRPVRSASSTTAKASQRNHKLLANSVPTGRRVLSQQALSKDRSETRPTSIRPRSADAAFRRPPRSQPAKQAAESLWHGSARTIGGDRRHVSLSSADDSDQHSLHQHIEATQQLRDMLKEEDLTQLVPKCERLIARVQFLEGTLPKVDSLSTELNALLSRSSGGEARPDLTNAQEDGTKA